MTDARTFTLPSGRTVRTTSRHRYLVIDDRDGEIIYRTDDRARAAYRARDNVNYRVHGG